MPSVEPIDPGGLAYWDVDPGALPLAAGGVTPRGGPAVCLSVIARTSAGAGTSDALIVQF